MTLRIARSRLARADALRHATYISRASSRDKGVEFFEALEDEYTKLATMPGMGSPRSFGNNQMRMMLVSGFDKYLIFYTHTDTKLQIIRVIHGARDLSAIFSALQE